MSLPGETDRTRWPSAYDLPPPVAARSRALRDVHLPALHGLTELLYMAPEVQPSRPPPSWLQVQSQMIGRLDPCVLRPRSLRVRVAISAGSHHIPHFPGGAVLCPTHRPLDPRVVRNLMLLVAHEFTRRADRFRLWRDDLDMADGPKRWLRRMDAETALWAGKKWYEKMFGRSVDLPPEQTVYSRCEACILAAIGGRPQALADLRTSMVARQLSTGKPLDRAPEPRLLCVVNSWISWHSPQSEEQIRATSDELVPDIVELRRQVDRKMDDEHRRRIAEGKGKKIASRPSQTADGLPLPREPHRQARRSGRHDRRSPGSRPSPATGDPHRAALDRTVGLGLDATNTEEETGDITIVYVHPEEYATATNKTQYVGDIDYGADYIDSVEEVRRRLEDLAASSRDVSIRDILHMDAALESFSDFAAQSAVPEPVRGRRRGSDIFEEGASVDNAWASVSAYTLPDEVSSSQGEPVTPCSLRSDQEQSRGWPVPRPSSAYSEARGPSPRTGRDTPEWRARAPSRQRGRSDERTTRGQIVRLHGHGRQGDG